MMRLRIGVMAVALGTSMMGCSSSHTFARFSLYHCDECDDFPTPAYGPGYSMMPGTYTPVGGVGPGDVKPPLGAGTAVEVAPPGQPTTTVTPPASTTPPATVAPPAITTPPVPPAAGPDPGAALGNPGVR
jgi:hypothetical protein